MSREQINHENTMARFPDGTLDRIKDVLRDGEKQSDFIREAVETLLKKREKKGKRK
jgi:Arc/MetJ-type ribon-helix-helix transcriptional regulator